MTSIPEQRKPDPIENNTWYKLKGSCGHTALTTLELRLQYPTDVHYYRCPDCNDTNVPTAWVNVTSVMEITDEHMSNVYSGIPRILSGDILRVQPAVPRHRIRIFPYKRRLR